MKLDTNAFYFNLLVIKNKFPSYEQQHAIVLDYIHNQYHAKLFKDENGKPFLVPNNNLGLSISHSYQYILIVLFNSQLIIGADIQRMSNKYNLIAYTKYDKLNDLSTYMTIIQMSFKESLGKYIGMGLLCDPMIYRINKLTKTSDSLFKCKFHCFPTVIGMGFLINDFIITIVFKADCLEIITEQLLKLRRDLFKYENMYDTDAEKNFFR
ncbi:4'-phosphopantetheinyl transferase family protein [Apilactobacillus quenuiae]|uniref:hypothetical protein n=1 Tax=Apilactobacillus quenuiae TaxID=2008377 RepID=UPI000D0127B6|nr:hypothetical protein [Apilactobacillus quenuiae]